MKIKNKNLFIAFLAVVALGFSVLFFKTWLYPTNLLLQKPVRVVFSKEDRLKKDWRGRGFHSNFDGKKFSIYFQEKFDDKRNHYFILTYPGKLPEELPEKYKKLFKYETRVINGKEFDLYLYSTGKLKDKSRWLKTYYEVLDMSLGKKSSAPSEFLTLPRVFPRNSQFPKKITYDECAELIKNKRFLFYTGSGISFDAGISTGAQLKNESGYDKTKMVDQFVKNVLTNPQAIINVHKKFEESFKYAQPTRAHIAISDIALRYNSHIITSNKDKLHEQTGIKAWDVMRGAYGAPWLGKRPIPESGNFVYLKANPQWLKDIDFVICVGMSGDVIGFLAWYKKHNPNGIIIAINKSELPYLGNEDYLIQGDIQEILPALARSLLVEF
jgi:NAD-dependent SIR2 family protein deacetylase